MTLRKEEGPYACIVASHWGLRSIYLGVSTQTFNYLFTHSVIQQNFNTYYTLALYTLWGKYRNEAWN